MLRLLAVSLILCLVSMSSGRSATKLQAKQRYSFIVSSFRAAGLDKLVRGKWLTAEMWGRYIHAYHPLADGFSITAREFHDAVRKDPILGLLQELDSKQNGEGVYYNKVTSTPRLNCYQMRRKGEARYDPPLKQGEIWSERLYNPFTQKFSLDAQFESSDDESNTGDDTTSMDMERDEELPGVENDDLPGDVVPDGFEGEDSIFRTLLQPPGDGDSTRWTLTRCES